jgi:uncharacterized protein with HEPN domain
MQRSAQTYIIDILSSIQEIESFMEGILDIHAYFNIEDEIIWNAVQLETPTTKTCLSVDFG